MPKLVINNFLIALEKYFGLDIYIQTQIKLIHKQTFHFFFIDIESTNKQGYFLRLKVIIKPENDSYGSILL